MIVKDRIIRTEKNTHSGIKDYCFIVDEYGIEDKKIYHRSVMINEDVYEKFESDPDYDMHLDAFLQRNNIHAEWQPFALKVPRSDSAANALQDSSRLFANIETEKIQNKDTELSNQEKNRLYKEIYEELDKKEALIKDPLVLDVFNEALKENPESADWESVFPFFR